MSPTDQLQDLIDRALATVPSQTGHSPLALHQRLNRQRARARFSALGCGVLAVAVSATALYAGLASNSAFAVTLYPGTGAAVVAAQLNADQRVMSARLRAVGFSSAVVNVAHGSLIVTNGPRDLAKPTSYLTESPELLIRGVTCYAGAQNGPVATDPLPAMCSSPQYRAPSATPSGTGFTEPTVRPDPTLSPYATTTPAQDASSPNAFALLPALNSSSTRMVKRFLVGPTLLTLSSKVASATVVPASIGGWMIDIRLDPVEARLWDHVAAEYFHRELAIDLNGVVDEAPIIQPANTSFTSFDGQMQLYAGSKSRAYDLAAALTTGPLTVPLAPHRFQSKQLPDPADVRAAQRLSSVLAKSFPSLYAGISLSKENSTINVFVTGASLGLISDVRALALNESVNYVTVVNTWKSLLAVHRQLETSWSSLKAQGVDIAEFSTDPTVNREVIDVVKLTQRQTMLLDQKFGANKIMVRGTSSSQVPVPLATILAPVSKD